MQAQKHVTRSFLYGGLLGLLLTGCAANVGNSIKVSDEQLAKYGTLSATDAIAALEKRVDEAKGANMPFLAPNYFRGATEILVDAQKSSTKKPKTELIGDIAKADAILDKGQTMMAVVQSRLANELALKYQMEKDNVPKIYPKEYEKSVSELSSLIEKVELEKADNIDNDKVELIKLMQALDVKTIQYITLHESELINEDTRSKDGEKQAPATLAEALRVYQDAKNHIAEAPHDEALVKRAGESALFAARHARYVNERVPVLQKTIKESVETIVLEEESRLFGISAALGHNDLRDQPIEKQAEEITRVAGEIVQGHRKSEQAIGAVNDQSKNMEKRLKEANDAMQQANVQLADKEIQLSGKEDQLKVLNEQIAQLEEENKALVKAEAAKIQASQTSKSKQKNSAK